MKSIKILLISIITIFLSSLAHAELNINRVITSVEGSGKWITVRTSFYNVDSDNVRAIFRMGIDGNLENGDFHALRFDERSFRIPKGYNSENDLGRFFFADYSVNSGAFRNLYNIQDTKVQANIEAACNYMNNSKVIDKILKTKSINSAHQPFLANPRAKESLSYLVDLCVETLAKVHVTDEQSSLTALGYAVGKADKDVNVAKVQAMLAELCYEPGIVDGAWGKKTETAVKAFFAKHYRKYDGNFDVNDANFILSAGASAKAFGSENVKKCLVVYSDRIGDNLKNAKIKQITQKVSNKNKLKKFKTGLTERKTIQFGLIALGYLKGNMNGNWDKKSNVALEIYLTKKNSKLKHDDFNEVIELLTKDLSKSKLADLQANIRKNSTILQYSRKEMKDILVPQQAISISDFKNMGKHNVYIAVDKKIMVNGNTRFNGNDKIFIIDSFINSKSKYRNQYDIKFGGRSFLNIINSISDSDENMEAFLFTYSGNATAMHLNFKHSMSSPWQVAKSHKGQFNFIDSTCNMTLFENSRSDINCNRADRVMIEPLLPKGRFEVSLPSNEKVKEWKSHKSLPWSINIKDSYIKNIDFGISPGVNLTVVDTDDFRGGIAMCCSGIGKITGLKANKLYENQSWSVSSNQGRAKLTLKNSSTGGVWPTAWGQYNFQINNSDLVDPTVGSNASMKIENSSLNMIRAQEQARVFIKNSVLTDTDDTSKKISAINASIIRIENLKGLKQRHIFEDGGRVIVKKD
tara:strand:+ start:25 stop:2271 length:2247 start_codon:yes stop_codon:yes gene_type:complete